MNDQGDFQIDVSQFSIHQESNSFNIKCDKTSGIRSVCIETFVDSGACLPI